MLPPVKFPVKFNGVYTRRRRMTLFNGILYAYNILKDNKCANYEYKDFVVTVFHNRFIHIDEDFADYRTFGFGFDFSQNIDLSQKNISITFDIIHFKKRDLYHCTVHYDSDNLDIHWISKIQKLHKVSQVWQIERFICKDTEQAPVPPSCQNTKYFRSVTVFNPSTHDKSAFNPSLFLGGPDPLTLK